MTPRLPPGVCIPAWFQMIACQQCGHAVLLFNHVAGERVAVDWWVEEDGSETVEAHWRNCPARATGAQP